ncbi:monooxygenase [Aspergillus nomiae NRRL 13137]|uniref:Monooxygenase n=1 Tax=Aspergillus nomiae NRRL (strain ATCC 15546 / NRRL 13137 / CBS 260.88 / M93) TaxID=1509407 RepID=A0A0L1JC75_ASPN3|nr:monooxygenase [Aspergillus nomiae NRRL 13137]KNG89349.1 monooxygenase [Aspergillus nomiae NRRL 13137]
MASNDFPSLLHDECPPRADLRQMMAHQPLPTIPPGTIDPGSITGDEPVKLARTVLRRLSAALADDDAIAVESCFFASQAYWKDQLALTYHLRTFSGPSTITTSLLETKNLREIEGEIAVDGGAQFIDCGIAFRTASPGANCKGKVVLLPVKNRDETIEWKIWVLSTFLEGLDVQQEDEALLKSPGRQLDGLATFDTDVFIIGGGNAAVTLAARLKALGVDSVMAERNPRPGDNWALRYDCMRFHIPTSFCDMPYMAYDEELRAPHLLTREELASQVRRYVETFNLNIITSAQILSTRYDLSTKLWEVKVKAPAGQQTAHCKHLVLATGIASQEPYLPKVVDGHLYQGTSLHSAQYKNGKQLTETGAKSVLVIGSANTAFDVLEDCHSAGLQTTMVVRSPTYVVPVEYVCDKHSLGAYDMGVEFADRLFMTLPSHVDAQLARGLIAQFAAEEPHRYDALAAAGFPVIDSRDPDTALMHNLLERAGGHYVDVGGTKLLTDRKAGMKAGVEPIAYTATGLRFSDGSTADADAVVWCTGFADKDMRDTAIRTLGGHSSGKETETETEKVLGPREIAGRLDATWGIDAEGEIRGLWKRQSRLENLWIAGGYTQQHRWHSRTLALQIKASLEGILPPAYLDTPHSARKFFDEEYLITHDASDNLDTRLTDNDGIAK